MEGKSAVYDYLIKHTPVKVGKKASSEEREAMVGADSTLTYGEIAFAPFATALHKIRDVYGGEQAMKGVFYDIGAGTGKPVFAAALLGDFSQCIGIEILTGLHGISLELQQRWQDKVLPALPEGTASASIDLRCEDFLNVDMNNATVWFANSTCFSDKLMGKLAEAVVDQEVGTFAITFTRSLPSPKWKVLESELHQMSWGGATVYIQQKVLP